ncbi:MAG: GerAB/ArcD/ProY family transporter [Syntrophomonadaceae bacterium]|jgi:spore germination protein KB
MSKVERISGLTLFLWLLAFTLGDMSILNPAVGAKAYQDSWLGFILGWAGGMILMLIYVSIIKLNPSQNLFDLLKECFGKYLGSILIVTYIWYFIYNGALVVREFGEYAVTVRYSQTPILFISALLLVNVAYAIKQGLEVVGRVAGLVVIFFILFIFTVTILQIPQIDPGNLLPFLEHGYKPVLKAGFSTLAFPFGELVLLLVIFTVGNQHTNFKKIGLLAVAIGGFIILITLFRDIMVLGPALLENQTYPAQASALIIPRPVDVSPTVVASLFIGSGAETVTYLYACALGITRLFNLEDYKPFVFPMAALMVMISIWNFTNIHQFFAWVGEIYPYYVLPFQIFIPLVVLFVLWFKKKAAPK